MAARKKAEEDRDCWRRVRRDGFDAIPDHRDEDQRAEDMGSILYIGHRQGWSESPQSSLCTLTSLQSSSEQQIKKRYRDLSKTLHPDKAVPDESRNETLESINDHWVEVSKAFKALTDEEIRNNYIQYGHPDGKQGFSIGIALPKFIITEGNGKYVLLVYGVLLGVLLPYSVGKWWYGTQRMTKEKVLLASASNLFQEYKDSMTDGDVVSALSSGLEYDEVLGGSTADVGLGKVEQTILQETTDGSTAAGLTPKDQEKLSSYEGVRRKAVTLLWAYLARAKLDAPTLDDGQDVPSRQQNHTDSIQRSTRSPPSPTNYLTPSSP